MLIITYIVCVGVAFAIGFSTHDYFFVDPDDHFSEYSVETESESEMDDVISQVV